MRRLETQALHSHFSSPVLHTKAELFVFYASTPTMAFSKFFIAALVATLASGRAIDKRGSSVSDTQNDMQDIIDGQQPCADVAMIFARGTFDSGNVGVWVGPQLLSAFVSNVQSAKSDAVVAQQGVDPSRYLADLPGYLTEGGSDDGSASLAETITQYVAACPNSPVVVTGWSQGALVVHKGIGQLSDDVLSKVAGVVTFGDPNHLFDNSPLPNAIPAQNFNSQCFTGTILDPLCANIPNDFSLPKSLSDVIGPFSKIPSIAVGAQQVAAAASLVAHFPGQLLKSVGSFASDVATGQVVRLLLSPQHFQYGNAGNAAQAAAFAASLPAVKAAIGA